MTSTSSTPHARGRAPGLRAAGIAAIIAAALVVAVVGLLPGGAGAQTAPSLGDAESFAVLGGSTVTNTGPSNVYGDLGVNPDTAVTGFMTVDAGPGTVHGTIYTGTDPEAVDARAAVTAAYTSLNQPCSTVPDGDLTGQDLGGLTLIEGVYCFDSSAGMTGTLTLDGQGNPDAVFIIRTGSTLITASGASVSLINEANACNVFWQVGSSATLGTTTTFSGNILATESITLDNGASIIGRALAGTGAVTMDDNVVDARPCIALSESATATAIVEATSTADAATATATSSTVPTATSSPTLAATSSPVPAATLTATVQATLTPATSTTTATVTTEATGTTTGQGTPTVDAPGAPSTGTGPPSGGTAPSLSIALAGAALLLIGTGGFVALATRRGGQASRPSR